MNWALYAIAAYLVYGVLCSVSEASKPPKPPKPGGGLHGTVLAGAVALNAAMITVITLAAWRMT